MTFKGDVQVNDRGAALTKTTHLSENPAEVSFTWRLRSSALILLAR